MALSWAVLRLRKGNLDLNLSQTQEAPKSLLLMRFNLTPRPRPVTHNFNTGNSFARAWPIKGKYCKYACLAHLKSNDIASL